MYKTNRRDNKGRILYSGETQMDTGRYVYRYTVQGKRRAVYSWRLTKSDPYPTGKRQELSLREKEEEIERQLRIGMGCTDMNVCELVERYLYTKNAVTYNTKYGYKFVQNILEKEDFGKKRINSVKTSDAKIFLISLQKNGRSYSVIHNIRGVLRPAFQMAVDDDILTKNPFNFQLANIIINDSVKRVALSKDEERKFLEFVKNDKHYSRYYDAIFLLFKTGLRISEFCGLTLGDIDFKERTIDVNHQLQKGRKDEYMIVSTKTTCGTRRLPITDEVEVVLRRVVKNRKKPKKEQMIDGYVGFLFLDKNGYPLVAHHWQKTFKLIREKYNKSHRVQMSKVTPHVCRHTYCSNMARAGVSPKVLQYLMGHADIETTLNIYTHVREEDARNELKKLNMITLAEISEVIEKAI